jgi:hypothetical protein
MVTGPPLVLLLLLLLVLVPVPVLVLLVPRLPPGRHIRRTVRWRTCCWRILGRP